MVQYLVIVDTWTNNAHFIPMKNTYQAPKIETFFVNEIVRLHGIPKKMILDRETMFTTRLWTSFTDVIRTQLNFITIYHPETNG